MVEVLIADPHEVVAPEQVLAARHELRSSLTVIRGNAQLLQRLECLSTAEALRLWQSITAIEAATTRLAEAVDQLAPPTGASG